MRALLHYQVYLCNRTVTVACRCRKQGVLVDGVVTALEKDGLTKMRRLMKVNDSTHARELKAAGWTMEEFDQG